MRELDEEQTTHNYNYRKDCAEWEKLHGNKKHIHQRIPKWMRSKGGGTHGPKTTILKKRGE